MESLVDVDRRLTLDQYRLLYGDPNGPRDRFVAESLAATTNGRPDRLHDLHAVRPQPRRRAARSSRTCAIRRARSRHRPGATVLVGGGAADVTDVVGARGRGLPAGRRCSSSITTYLVLFMLLRSVILPAKALVMNTLSIAASFGALVWIFQDGNLSAILGFQPLGFVETTQPVILFCVLFGLSMDYEVFLLSRMKEVWDRTGDNVEAVARGLERSGRIVTSAALIVVLVAGSFAFADIVLIKALGVGMAIAVALDATVVRALLVPATMRLLGRWNWWMPAIAGAARREPAAGIRGGCRGGGPMMRRTTALLAIALFVAAVRRSDWRARSSPTRRAARPSVAVPTATPVPRRGSAARRPAAGRRSARPPDRVVVLHRPSSGADDGRRFGFEYVIFRAERGAFPTTWASHLAITDEAGDRFAYAQRLDVGPQVDRSPRDATGTPSGFDLSLTGEDPSRPETFGRPAWSMRGSSGDDRLVAGLAADEAALAGVPGGLGLDLTLVATKPPRSTTPTAGSTSEPPAARTTTRARRWTRSGRLTFDERDPRGRRNGLVRPPVGRLHLGGGRRLGLVRRQPVRRSRRDDLARPGRRRQLSRWSTAPWSIDTARRRT